MKAATQVVDTPRLLWTLAALVLTSLPHVMHLPWWPFVLMAFTVSWRLAAITGRYRLPGVVVRLLLAAAGFAGVLLSYRSINGLEAGSALLLVMSALKLTETRYVRDLVVLILISYFLIVTQFLFAQSVFTALAAIPAVWLVTTALMQTASAAPPLAWRRALSRSGILLAQAVPLMIIAFVLFPRFSGPFWAIPRAENAAVTGLSDSMSPGSITELLESEAVAFRVKFDGTPPPRKDRYWRGLVLSNFDGRTWSVFKARDRNLNPDTLQPLSNAIGYEIMLEPHHQHWLFALEQADPASLPRGSYLTNDRRLTRNKPVTQLYQYRVESWPEYSASLTAADWEMRRDTQFDTRLNPRTQELAQQWRSELSSDAEIVNRALYLFRNEQFFYTLSPPALNRDDAVDEFLFQSRRGFCEHYASSFSLLMRAAGVPARVVVGYQGGEVNPYTGHMTIRQSDAHAWSEVWLPDRGWVRVDPTAAVAPARVELGVAGSVPDGETLPSLFRASQLLYNLQLGWDAFNNGWNEWVLGFSRNKQIDFLKLLGMRDPSLRKMLLTMLALIGIVVGLLSVHLLWQSRPRRADALTRLYDRFCRNIAPAEGGRRPAEAPLHFAARVSAAHPERADLIHLVTNLYLDLRYTPNPQTSLSELRRAIRSA
ncbi:MAG: DUF3488 domain-containing transglutaminase family protein [Gammaproteobacteria bacterium]|nr:DUF3488 domain-containing transglutaminase family protein [Gammaproteobacteria bacterium]